MAVAVASSSQANAYAAGTSGLTISKPSGVSDGDVLYAFVVRSDELGGDFSCSGWTLLDSAATSVGNDIGSAVLRKVITNAAGEPSTYTFTNTDTASRNMSGFIVRITGADTGAPEDATTTKNTGTNDWTPTQVNITTNTDGALLLAFHGANVGTATTKTAGPPSGFTLIDSIAQSRSTNLYTAAEAAHATAATAGSQTLDAWTGTPDDASSEWHVYTIAVKPAASTTDALTAVGITTTPEVAGGAASVTATGRYNGKGTLSGTPAGFTTGSVSYNAGSVLVAIVDTADYSTNNIPTGTTFTGGGLTWTKRLSRGDINGNSYYVVHEVWTAEPSSSGSSTFTWQRAAGSVSDSGWGCQIIEIEGQASSWLGTSKTEACTTAGSYTLTLSASPASSSLVLAYRCAEGLATTSSPATPGTGWTEIYDYAAGHNGWADIQSMYRGNSTSTSVTWDQIGTAGQIDTAVTTVGAIEFIAAPGGPTVVNVPTDNLTATGIAAGAPSTGGGAGGTVVHTNISTNSVPQQNAINWTSGSFTPADNSLLVVSITWQRDSNSTPTLTVTGGGLTWTERERAFGPDNSDFNQSIWTAPVSSGASMTINVQLSHSFSANLTVVGIEQFTGIDTSSPVGLHNSVTLAQASGGYNLSLGGTTAADSMVYAVGSGDEANIAIGASWTQIAYTTHNWNETETAKKTGAMSQVDWTTLNGGWTQTAGAIEIKAGAGGGPTLEDVEPVSLTATGITTGAPTTGGGSVTRNLASSGEVTGTGQTGDWVSSSFAATAGQLMVVFVQWQNSENPWSDPEVGISSAGMTFTYQAGIHNSNGTNPCYIEIYTGIVPSSGNRTVTVNAWSIPHRGWVHVFLYDNVDQTTPVRQVVENWLDKDVQNNGAYSFNLTSAPLASSEVIVGSMEDSAYGSHILVAPGTGWTAILNDGLENHVDIFGGVHIIARGGSTSQAVSYNDIDTADTGDTYLNLIFAGIEIAAGAGGGPTLEDVAPTGDELTATGIAASPVVGSPDVAQIKLAAGQLDAALSWTSTANASRPRSAQLDATLALTSQAGALRPGSAQLDATAAVSANGDAQKTGTASLTVSLTASSSAQATRYRSASLTISLTKGVAAQALRYRSSTQTTNLTLVVSAGGSRPRSAQLDGSLAIAASAGIVRDASAALTASGTLASSGERVRVGSAALAASVGIASTAVAERSGSSSLGVALAISSSANASRPASASVTAAATATTSASAIKSVSAALTANLSLIAVPAGTAVGSITAAATLSSSAQATRPRSAQLDTNLSVAVSGNAYRPRSAQLDATLSTTVAAQATRPASATLNTAAAVSAAGQASRTASATLSISGATQGTAGAIRQVGASLTAALTFLALPAGAGAAFLTAGLAISVSAQADKQRSATLTAALSTLVSAQAIRPAAAALTTSLSLAATATGLGEGSATLTTSATLSASADRYAYRSSTLAATASVASSAERISGATTTMATVLSVAASAGAIRPASSQMDAALSVNGQPTGQFVRSASLATSATIAADGLNKPRFTITLEARLSLRCGWGAAPKKAIVGVKAGSVRPEPSAGKVRPGVTAGRVNVKIM